MLMIDSNSPDYSYDKESDFSFSFPFLNSGSLRLGWARISEVLSFLTLLHSYLRIKSAAGRMPAVLGKDIDVEFQSVSLASGHKSRTKNHGHHWSFRYFNS